MGMMKVIALASVTLWKVLAVAGVFLLVVVPPMPPPPTSLQPIKKCHVKLSSIARRIVHQV